MFRRAVILLGALLLSGCSMWSGPPLYPVDKSYSWLPHGTYRAEREGKSQYGRWDGKAFFVLPSGKKQKQDRIVTLVALPGTKLHASIAQISAADGKNGALYALVVRDGDTWTYALPDCATTRRIVTDAGGIMDGNAPFQKQVTTENVTVADLEEAMEPLPAVRGRKHHRRSRRAAEVNAAPIAQTESVESVEASPASENTDDGSDEYGSKTCRFPTRSSLEAAARRYLAERQLIGDKVTRIGD